MVSRSPVHRYRHASPVHPFQRINLVDPSQRMNLVHPSTASASLSASSSTYTTRFGHKVRFLQPVKYRPSDSGVGDYCGAITENGVQTCSASGQRYRYMIRDFVIPQLQQRTCLQDIIFMQDGVPPHKDRRVDQLLRQQFKDARVISRHFPTAWPARSPDITPCDFWLWGFLKDNIYCKRPASLPDLKDRIRCHVLDIPTDSLRSAMGNMVLRLEHIVEHEGGYIEQF
ncbi:hypothetical protein AVEN_134293-1 [Araneus ventricosus]|uniref:Tc1-like transposase DDE domain-containing protein n=1 Tax=Araneus ventricosus TaxID=182803 RepID=A0A4Y2RAC2_ARAVE|nr:hypothetical protein AVEN_134293-1 [Araneus ventricosus]